VLGLLASSVVLSTVLIIVTAFLDGTVVIVAKSKGKSGINPHNGSKKRLKGTLEGRNVNIYVVYEYDEVADSKETICAFVTKKLAERYIASKTKLPSGKMLDSEQILLHSDEYF
jgi:hypothetical protein